MAAPGQTVAIVGPTGAGKTTLVNLIMRFYEIDSGRITLDGVDVAQMTRADLRSRIGMVLQDTWLFAGTIRDNIAYGRPDATEEEILAAAKATYVDRFVHSLPDGYDTLIDDEGSNISAGEKQLLTIARAFLADPALLILDEATSSVDTRTEVLVQHAMAALRADRTSFVIAHRLSTIRDADLILVMESGAIVEQGTHDRAAGARRRLRRAVQRAVRRGDRRRVNRGGGLRSPMVNSAPALAGAEFSSQAQCAAAGASSAGVGNGDLADWMPGFGALPRTVEEDVIISVRVEVVAVNANVGVPLLHTGAFGHRESASRPPAALLNG